MRLEEADPSGPAHSREPEIHEDDVGRRRFQRAAHPPCSPTRLPNGIGARPQEERRALRGSPADPRRWPRGSVPWLPHYDDAVGPPLFIR